MNDDLAKFIYILICEYDIEEAFNGIAWEELPDDYQKDYVEIAEKIMKWLGNNR